MRQECFTKSANPSDYLHKVITVHFIDFSSPPCYNFPIIRSKEAFQVDFIEEVKYWVSKAIEADPELKVFGASSHKYQFAPPIDMKDVLAFEQKHDIKLPENYVRILTELGNGGPGPYYGFVPAFQN